MRNRVRSGVGVMVCVATLCSCTILIDADRQQCIRDSDCSAAGSSFECAADGFCVESEIDSDDEEPVAAGRWQCLDEITFDKETELLLDIPADFTIQVLVDRMPAEGIEARVCAANDLGCTEPEMEGLVSDSEGQISLELPRNFSGYIEVKEEGFHPHLYFLSSPYLEPKLVPRMSLVREDSLPSPDPAYLFVMALDCNGVPAGGVEINVPSGGDATSVTYIETQPAPGLTETVEGSGLALITTEPGSGVATVRMTNAESDKVLATFSVTVRANAVTQIQLVGGPHRED